MSSPLGLETNERSGENKTVAILWLRLVSPLAGKLMTDHDASVARPWRQWAVAPAWHSRNGHVRLGLKQPETTP